MFEPVCPSTSNVPGDSAILRRVEVRFPSTNIPDDLIDQALEFLEDQVVLWVVHQGRRKVARASRLPCPLALKGRVALDGLVGLLNQRLTEKPVRVSNAASTTMTAVIDRVHAAVGGPGLWLQCSGYLEPRLGVGPIIRISRE